MCLTKILRLSSRRVSTMAPPRTIRDFGYVFNSQGQLRRVDDQTGEASEETFQFNVSDNHHDCQKHYEALGEAITEHVYKVLEDEEKLIRLPVPDYLTPDAGTFIFVSRDFDKKKKLLILIHGSGVVRAGQWARSLIINDNFESGTQIPYVKKAFQNNFGVLIMNTNDNYRKSGKIPNSSTPEEHACYVWKQYIAPTKAVSIAFVAHSYGGVLVLELANKFKADFEKKVKAVAFTDSVHAFSRLRVTKHLREVGRNWVACEERLDSAMATPDTDVTRVSAGHEKHEMTSHACLDSVFRFFSEKVPNK